MRLPGWTMRATAAGEAVGTPRAGVPTMAVGAGPARVTGREGPAAGSRSRMRFVAMRPFITAAAESGRLGRVLPVVRRALEPLGWTVDAVPGAGYVLVPEVDR